MNRTRRISIWDNIWRGREEIEDDIGRVNTEIYIRILFWKWWERKTLEDERKKLTQRRNGGRKEMNKGKRKAEEGKKRKIKDSAYERIG
jgi:hypothetical protein